MDVRPIHTETDYEWALEEVRQYFEAEPAQGTPEADRFDVLSTLIDAYEAAHWAIDPPDAVEAVKAVMEERQLTREGLVPLFGSKSRVSEFLNRKRGLSMAVASRLHEQLRIPAAVLLRSYELDAGDTGSRKCSKQNGRGNAPAASS
ncbi:XRE family transcriptional regulator [Aureimonas altamirensis]|uniref:helix-turn-helix domain-containing protein n=1 Tax=Aureimonas altamirensis TaxID=370622 RepID=UPI00203691DE|nr:XRE family transcriptional regulator [Aureimonas altamirensis]MCM2503296.1 XRE family transcriptional regulator [Aureimonas altamirensis]